MSDRVPSAPRRPEPVGKNPNLPRPYVALETGKLMDLLSELGEVIAHEQEETKKHIAVRTEMMLELVRRDVSYRAMARAAGLTAPTVLRIVERNS